MAARAHPGQALRAADYTIRIGTERADADRVLTTAMRALAENLGPGTGVTVFDDSGQILAHNERPATS